jgi:hypothetical protein
MFLFSTILFFVLSPGILLTIPPKSSKTTVALVHALVFSTLWYFTHTLVWNAFYGNEEFRGRHKTGTLRLVATRNWIKNHPEYITLGKIIDKMFPNLKNNATFAFKTKDPNNKLDAVLTLKDRDYPNGKSYILDFDKAIDIPGIITFLNDSGYAGSKIIL